ncbi:MAG: glycosyltransferase family 2 protein [Phototrophicales bacterium]|nr:MAG: glycosyltransferase family 2 protein [Phototrophicales bacterium]
MSSIQIQIVTYNSAKTIEACIKSALEQTGVDFSIVVIDNASEDNTVDIVESLGVPCIRNETNVGYAVAHNQAFELSKSTYVLTLNPDVYLMPDYLWHLQQALDANPTIGSAAGCLLRVESLEEQPQFVDSTGLLMLRSRRQKLRDDGVPLGQHHQEEGEIFGPDGAAAFYRRAMLEDIRIEGDIFDSDFFIHKEDVDLCWRAQLRGWHSIYVPSAIAHHIRSFRPGKRERVSDDLRCYALRNRYLLMWKNDIPAHFWRDFPYIFLYDVMILGYVLLKERKSLAAYRSLWQLRQKTRHKRQMIQQGRKVSWHRIRSAFGGQR